MILGWYFNDECCQLGCRLRLADTVLMRVCSWDGHPWNGMEGSSIGQGRGLGSTRCSPTEGLSQPHRGPWKKSFTSEEGSQRYDTASTKMKYSICREHSRCRTQQIQQPKMRVLWVRACSGEGTYQGVREKVLEDKERQPLAYEFTFTPVAMGAIWGL